MTTDKYASFYEEAPTFSAAIAALKDKECPEQVVADILSFKILPTDDGTIGDRLTQYNYLLPAGIQDRELSSDALNQILNTHIEEILDWALEFADLPGCSSELAELIESEFSGLLEQVNLSSTSMDGLTSGMDKLSMAMIDARSSGIGVDEGFDYHFYFSHFVGIFEALAVHPNATKEQKDKCLQLSELMKIKEAEASED